MPQTLPDPAERAAADDVDATLDDGIDDAAPAIDAGPVDHRRLQVPESLSGGRFDAVLAEMLPEFSRSRLSAWIKSGDALLDGAQVRPRDPVRGGETVTVAVAREIETRAEPEDIPLSVLYEDAEVLVVDKPAGLVVHPGAGNHSGTLVNALLFRDPTLALLPRAGIVHRQYLAIVVGALVSGGTANAPIDRHPRDRLKMGVRDDGREAVTHYRLRERFRAHTALECRLETGRTHQIRVHMAHLRHAILGDPLYGGPLKLPKAASEELVATLRGFRRQALHAETLEFAHPTTGEPVRCSAPVPADMLALMAALREDAALHAQATRRR